MSILKRCLPLTLIVFIAFYSCANFDGGSRGTGITSTAQGTVADVQGTSNPSVQNIKVNIARHSASHTTGSAGAFTLQGRFSGHQTIIFTRKSDGLRAQLTIYLPSAGTITLNGVHLDNASGNASADSSDVDFLGEITDVDCPNNNLMMLSARRRQSDDDSYIVRLDTSSVVDSNGNPVSCSDLQPGQLGHVQGTVNPDESFGHARVVIQ
jgi:hypothetical protein